MHLNLTFGVMLISILVVRLFAFNLGNVCL